MRPNPSVSVSSSIVNRGEPSPFINYGSRFASKLRQANFRQTFLPTKDFLLPRNQLKASSVNQIAAIQQIAWMTRSGNGCCPFYLRISVSQRKFFFADSISHLPKNWNQIRSEIVIFLLVKNKMIQIGASLRVVGIPLKWHVSQTGQSAKKVSDALFAKMLEK